jgi:DNA helicase-2/ATP-dependent DNA helicase PcrA
MLCSGRMVIMHALLQDLNEAQREGVLTVDGPVLMLAGAGSGKTKTLTHRIAYLVEEKKIHPSNILAVTFTNKAATEMRQRINSLLGRDSDDRSYLPFLGTFHSIAVRILRREAMQIGYPQSFVIYDEADAQAVVKLVCKDLGIEEKVFSPQAIRSAISSAKNELILPGEYAKLAQGRMQETAARVYPEYQRRLRENGAMDFDDIIMQTVRLFEENTEVLERYQKQFAYILVDEYQDTNHAQYRLIQMLAVAHNNICVVGDDWQCIPAGSQIETKTGWKAIEQVAQGDEVRSASGYGNTQFFSVQKRKRFKYSGELIKIMTESGKLLRITPNHMLFARWGVTESYFVYLMYAQQFGFRIGIARGTRFDGKKYDTGLRVRANQERADRMWVLAVTQNRSDAILQESLLAYKYGIPMMVFHALPNRSMSLSQQQINTLYQEIDTTERAKSLMADFGLDYDYPHFSPQATTRGEQNRVNVNLVLFGDKRVSRISPWSASRLSVNTTSKIALKTLTQAGLRVRPGRAGTHRAEIHSLDYSSLEATLLSFASPAMQVTKYGFLTAQKFSFMLAGQVYKDMVLPTLNARGQLIDDRIVKVERESYQGFVYDLDIGKVHNYIADGVAVHNSIYSWRGANYENILNFESDYPNAKVIKLEQNYRSTQHILDAAHSVITKNTVRTDKQLFTQLGQGEKIIIQQVADEQAEGQFVIQAIDKLVAEQGYKYSDCAVLYRTNAQSRSLEESFLRYNMPYQIVGGLRFYERKEIKDTLAYMRFVANPQDTVSWRRIVNVPARGLGDKSLAVMSDYASLHDLDILTACASAGEIPGLTPKAKAAFEGFATLIHDFRESSERLPVAELAELILKKTGYLDALNDGSLTAGDRIENVQEFLGVARGFGTTALEEFLSEISLVTDLDGWETSTDAVTLMTLHAAKGLEFRVVFMIGMEEGIFPHSRTLFEPAELEEERRLCYVGMTRARERLYLTHATMRLLYGSTQRNTISRFIMEIPPDYSEAGLIIGGHRLGVGLPRFGSDKNRDAGYRSDPFPDELEHVVELEIGDTVEHAMFGKGKVLDIEEDDVQVSFERVGIKRLNLNFAPLKKL